MILKMIKVKNVFEESVRRKITESLEKNFKVDTFKVPYRIKMGNKKQNELG